MNLVQEIERRTSESCGLSCTYGREGQHWTSGYMLSEFLCSNCLSVTNMNTDKYIVTIKRHVPFFSVGTRIFIDEELMSLYSPLILGLPSINRHNHHCGNRLFRVDKKYKRLKGTVTPKSFESFLNSVLSILRFLKDKNAIVTESNLDKLFCLVKEEDYVLTLNSLSKCSLVYEDRRIESPLEYRVLKVLEDGEYQKVFLAQGTGRTEYHNCYQDILFYQIIISLVTDILGPSVFFENFYPFWQLLWKEPEKAREILLYNGSSYSKLLTILGQMEIRRKVIDLLTEQRCHNTTIAYQNNCQGDLTA